VFVNEGGGRFSQEYREDDEFLADGDVFDILGR
jgi:hypothetical protein